ncbi:MAG TPA: hypothetical protein VHL11_21980, partial [Phototrophicaceae bacterium]|nr:hypothetical protein [Phototrophicaceae bacterium]
RAYASLGSLSAGLENGEKAIEIDPTSAEAHRSYAFALNSASARDEATAQLEQAVILNPSYVPLYFELAAQYLAVDRDDEAIDLYNQVLLLQPENARAYLRLCDAYRKKGDFIRGEDFCENAVQVDPTYTAAQFRLGMIKYSQRDFERALIAFQACVDVDAENLECYYRLGLTHYYLSLEARALETQPTPGPTFTPNFDITPARNEMLEEAMLAVTQEKLGQPTATVTPTLPPQPADGKLSSAEHCDLAWTILQDSLSKAQITADSDEMVADIRLGLSLVAQDCPNFYGAAPTLTPSLTPEVTLTAIPTSDASVPDVGVPDPASTEEVTNDG